MTEYRRIKSTPGQRQVTGSATSFEWIAVSLAGSWPQLRPITNSHATGTVSLSGVNGNGFVAIGGWSAKRLRHDFRLVCHRGGQRECRYNRRRMVGFNNPGGSIANSSASGQVSGGNDSRVPSSATTAEHQQRVGDRGGESVRRPAGGPRPHPALSRTRPRAAMSRAAQARSAGSWASTSATPLAWSRRSRGVPRRDRGIA